jgi:type III restriction enzyme
MKLKFDANQDYQLEAVKAVVEVFEGQPLKKGDFEVQLEAPEDQLQYDGEIIVGNNLRLSPTAIMKNVHSIQEKNELEKSEVKIPRGGFGAQGFGSSFGGSGEPAKLKDGLNFSVEMETGTGKTYVYLRTIHELYKKYGFKKYIIVVPSLAIKEGVVKNLKITKEHFSTIYENPEMDFYVYDPKKRGALKNFATANTIQILVINIDSFAKFNENKGGHNIIYKTSDWGVPIEYIQGTKPIVIVDEPQNMETEKRKQAIENLNPLCTLRYSATHKHHYNLLHKLDPVKAYDLGLVKKIEVDSVITDESHNDAFLELKSVQAQKTKITAKIRIDVVTAKGVDKKDFTVKVGADLYELSGQREVYKDLIIDSIDVSAESITLTNGAVLYVGQSQGGVNDEVMKFQLKKTVQNHLEREKKLKEKGIKVLSLIFIDRVANYRNYTESGVEKGKFALWFEEIFKELSQSPAYKDVITGSLDKIHNGYFSADKKGNWKDSNGNTQADDDTYELIMKDKERLLSPDNPLRFIFSHSALREGWDNPNVFQICTLNETKSDIKKRQEIGRGLRLPVNENGERIFDDNVNILTVIANESYEDFAKTLQTEIEQECGVDFGGRVKNKRDRTAIKLKKGFKLDENFKALWDRIKHKTRYQVEYDTGRLVSEAGKALEEIEISTPKIISRKARLGIKGEGVETELVGVSEKRIEARVNFVPDVLGNIQGKTRLTKDTILKILKESGRIADILKNPQQFIDLASDTINRILRKMMIDGIKYEKISGEYWKMELFEDEELEGYLENMLTVQDQEKTLYDHVLLDSEVESDFAKDLESREDVKFYIKLPYWFKIPTPIGEYNPDWAIVFEKDKRVYFVAETKGAGQELRESVAM